MITMLNAIIQLVTFLVNAILGTMEVDLSAVSC